MKAFFKSVLSTTVGMVLGTFITFLILIAVVSGAMKFAQGSKAIEKNSILQLRLSGELVEKHRPLDFDLFGQRSIFREERTLGLYEINKAIDLAKTDKRISGIYLEIRDLDAGWAALTSLRRHLQDFAKSDKWIYAYGDQYNEKTYYLATAATQIYLQPNGDMQFGGLSVTEAFFKGLFDKLGVEPRIFRVGRFKSAVEPFMLDHMSEENRKQNQVLLDDIWSEVRQAAAQRAKIGENRIDEIASNLQATSAQEARKLGLVNELLYEDELEDKMAGQTVGDDEELPFVSAGQLLHDHKTSHHSGAKKIALIFADGEISAGLGEREAIGSESLREDILDASHDDNVAAIVLRVNSPGGDALASDVIWRELMVQDEDMPVVVSMGDVAASGGYYIASAGRYIFAEPTTITGSIGVFGLMFGTEKLFREKAGVKFDRVVTNPYADLGDANRPITPLESKTIQGDVERVYKRFIDVVEQSRGYENRADLEAIAEGRVWSGKQAKELGLVDEIGGLDQAMAKAAEFASLGKDYDVEIFPKDSDPFMAFIDRFSGDTIEAAMNANTEVSFLRKLTRAFPFLKNLAHASSTAVPKSGIYARLPMDLDVH